jgi:hypothetical protein
MFGACKGNILKDSKKYFQHALHAPIGDHLTPILRGFLVRNQIPNLTLGPSFDHNSCILSLNEQCKDTLNMYISRVFQWYPRAPIDVLFFFNQGSKHSRLPHECNSQSGSALGSHWTASLAFSPICQNVFHFLTHFFGLKGLCIPHLVANSMLGL